MRTLRLLRPEILRSLPPRLAVLEASAGTGKTWTLERLFVELVLVEKLRIEQILAVTFTERATAEMKARVRQTFEALLDGNLEEAPPGAPDEAVWTVDEEGRRRVERALASFDTAAISTIHSFCQRILTEYAFPGGRLLAQERADGRKAFGEAFRDLLRTSLSTDPALLPWLVAWQARRPLEELERLLWEALRARAPFLPPFDGARFAAAAAAAAATATAAAAPALGTPGTGRIWQAFETAVAERSRDKLVRTLGRLLAALEEYRARPSVPALLSAISSDPDRPAEYLPKVLGDPLGDAAAERIRAALLPVLLAAVPFETALVGELLPVAAARFDAGKRRAGAFDFDDMIAEVASVLGSPAGAPLVQALRARFRAALIDEFQDTDELQWGIFRRLFFDSPQGHRLVVIGDPKQAIYAFRGADVATYLAARDLMASAGGAVPLARNFRSTPAMVDAVNAILDQRGPEPLLGSGEIRYDSPVTAGRTDLSVRSASGEPVVPVHLLRMRVSSPVKGGLARATLGRRIAAEIRTILDGPGVLVSSPLDDGGEPCRLGPGDIFVLTRKGSESREIGGYLDEARIPYAFYREEGLLESAEAEEFLHVLRALADPAGPALRMRALLTPFFGLSLRDLEGARDLPPAHPALRRLLDGRTLALAGRWSDLFRLLLAGSGLVRRELATAAGERSLTNFHHVAELLLMEAARRPGTIQDLVRALASWTARRALPEGEDVDMQRLPTAGEAVQVMTIHKAKGLEAPVVFVYGGLSAMRTGLVRVGHLPDRSRFAVAGKNAPEALLSSIETDAEREERRLLYVAATRARGLLYLPYFHELPKTTKSAKKGETQESVGRFGPKATYHPLNTRLRVLLRSALPAGKEGPLFAVDDFDPSSAPLSAAAPRADLSGWTLPPELLEAPPDRSEELERLGRGRNGFFVTSYTGLKKLEGGYRAAGEKPSERAAEVDVAEVVEVAGVADATGATEASGDTGGVLPGGRATGTMLHSLLEEVDPRTLAAAQTAEEWAALPGIAPLLRRLLAAHGFDPRPEGPHSAPAARLVHAALTTEVPLPGGGSVPGLGLAPGAVREMEFLYPVPEEGHPLLAAGSPSPADGPPYRIGRGCVTGFVDLLFTHEGKSFFLDWKSDILPSFDEESLVRHVEANYETQAHLYTLALLRLLGVSDEASFEGRFGGFLYVFLRGLDPASPGTGVYARRPSWREVLETERALLDPARFAALGAGR